MASSEPFLQAAGIPVPHKLFTHTWQDMEESGWKAAKFLAADRDACRPRPYLGQ